MPFLSTRVIRFGQPPSTQVKFALDASLSTCVKFTLDASLSTHVKLALETSLMTCSLLMHLKFMLDTSLLTYFFFQKRVHKLNATDARGRNYDLNSIEEMDE